MFSDLGIIRIFLVTYLFYAFYNLIKDCFFFLKSSYKGKEANQSPVLTKEMIEEAMKNRIFGDFTLTPAIVFFKDGNIIPSEGYKIEKNIWLNGSNQFKILVSASSEKVLDIFDEFLILLGDTCNVVLEDFRTDKGDHIDHFAYYKDTFVVRSILLDFDELLLNDGFVGLAIWNEAAQAEVQLTRYKVILIYAKDIDPFKQVFAEFGIKEDPDLRFFFEDFHMLVSTKAGDMAVEALKDNLCIDNSVVQWGGFEGINN